MSQSNFPFYKTPIIETTSTSSLTPSVYNGSAIYNITALAENLTLNAPTGNFSNGFLLEIIIKDNGTTRTLTWNAAYVVPIDGSIILPTATLANKMHSILAQYNNSQWNIITVL